MLNAMSDDTVAETDKWRIRALAKSISTVLQQRFESKQLYTPDEVEAACDECHATEALRHYALVMFVDPELAGGVLERLGSSQTAQELRKFLASQVFLSPGVDVASDRVINKFHAAGDPGGGASDWSAADWADGGCDGGADGGGDGGGD